MARWPAEREERLRILWDAGFSLASIGGALGVSERAVRHKCSAFGLRRHVSVRWPLDRERQLIQLWRQGLSATVIGETLGVSKNAVLGKIDRLRFSAGAVYPALRAKPSADYVEFHRERSREIA